jgi:endonuclease YncB( thermonuclease family)
MTDWAWPGSSITRVIDGDSVTARLTRDLGFHGTVTFEQRLRLARINAAPVKTTFGARAAAMVAAATMPDVVVNITTTGAYKFGDEWMAEIVLPDGTNLSDDLVGAGLAVYWDGQGPRPGG